MLKWLIPPGSGDSSEMFGLGGMLQELKHLILENRRLQMTADEQLATALDDLGTAVSNMQTKTEAATSEISSLVQQVLVAAGNGEQDKITAAAARIEALVGDINAESTALGDAVSSATAPAPVVDETPAPVVDPAPEPVVNEAPPTVDPVPDPEPVVDETPAADPVIDPTT